MGQVDGATSPHWTLIADEWCRGWRPFRSLLFNKVEQLVHHGGDAYTLDIPRETPLQRLLAGLEKSQGRRTLRELTKAERTAVKRFTYGRLCQGLKRFEAHYQALVRIQGRIPRGHLELGQLFFVQLVDQQLEAYRRLIDNVRTELGYLGSRPTREAFLKCRKLHKAAIGLASWVMHRKHAASLAALEVTAEARVSSFMEIMKLMASRMGNGAVVGVFFGLLIGGLAVHNFFDRDYSKGHQAAAA